jgi:hypothetical protein
VGNSSGKMKVLKKKRIERREWRVGLMGEWALCPRNGMGEQL